MHEGMDGAGAYPSLVLHKLPSYEVRHEHKLCLRVSTLPSCLLLQLLARQDSYQRPSDFYVAQSTEPVAPY